MGRDEAIAGYVSLPYKPTKGFFDLGERPKGMSKTVHEKIQLMQMDLTKQASKYKDQKMRADNSRSFEQLREYMAQLQQIILSNWPHEMLFKPERRKTT